MAQDVPEFFEQQLPPPAPEGSIVVLTADHKGVRMRHERRTQRPRPQNKRLRAELTQRFEGEEIKGTKVTFPWFEQEVTKRNPYLGLHGVLGRAEEGQALRERIQTTKVEVAAVHELSEGHI